MIHGPLKKPVMYLSYVLPSPLSVCVSEHQNFLKLPYGKKLKINLMLNSSLVQLYYSRGSTRHLLLDKGEFTDVTAALVSLLLPLMLWLFISVFYSSDWKLYFIKSTLTFKSLNQHQNKSRGFTVGYMSFTMMRRYSFLFKHRNIQDIF